MVGFYCLPTTTHLLMPVYYSLAVLGVKCLVWLYLSLMSIRYALYWIAFNSCVERWTILTLINNECGGVIYLNALLPVGLLVTLLPIWRVNRYSCHLWGAHLMHVVVIHHMDDAVFLFFCYMMDEGDFFLFSWPSIPTIVFTNAFGICKVTLHWLLYSSHLLWWMFLVSSWHILVCDYLIVLEPFLGFLAHFFFICLVWTKIVCMNDNGLYRVSMILF